jgi:hypothetical protein
LAFATLGPRWVRILESVKRARGCRLVE